VAEVTDLAEEKSGADAITVAQADSSKAAQADDQEEASPEVSPSVSSGTAVSSGPISQADVLFTAEDKIEPYAENIMDGDFDMRGNEKANLSGIAGDNYIEDIYLKFVGRNDENLAIIANDEVNEGFDENSDEKSVDSNENIDKMGIENNIHDSDILTIEECIDEAFRLRETGDPEGSILYYMYALDKKPQKELPSGSYWIYALCISHLGSRNWHLIFLTVITIYMVMRWIVP
jgi:hypothetical protein